MKMKTIWSYLIILMFTTSLMAQNILSTSEFEIIKKNAYKDFHPAIQSAMIVKIQLKNYH